MKSKNHRTTIVVRARSSRSFSESVSQPRCQTWLRAAAVLCALLTVQIRAEHAGGNLVARGDTAVLVAPAVNFFAELERMHLVTSRFRAVPVTEADASHANQTASGEAADLRAALVKAGKSEEQVAAILAAHQKARDQISEFLAAYGGWEGRGSLESGEAAPLFPKVAIPEGLPGEFADYLTGALAWRNPAILDRSMARVPWERLMGRPAEERRYKSTWAAFMMGKSWEQDDPEKAIGYFRQVRDLARKQFVDSIGLAAASLGLEARVQLSQTNYERAIELYLEQFDTGDETALGSLRIAAAQALRQDAELLRPLALNPRTQRVLTSFASSSWMGFDYSARMGFDDNTERADPGPGEVFQKFADVRLRWLDVAEAAGVSDRESAEKLALAAYQAGDKERTARWVKLAGGGVVAEWVRAKILLREAKVDQAIALLTRIAPSFPLEPRGTNELQPATLVDHLVVPAVDLWRAPGRQVLGELGVLHLTRGHYVQALDCLLRAGLWLDAAYVAERVLTPDELKAYVDRNWAAVPPATAGLAKTSERSPEAEAADFLNRERIRHLLARRLTRITRGDEARSYYPLALLPQFDALVAALRTGWDEAVSSQQRAQALFSAAWITRTNGIELIATEVEPDWAVYHGEDVGTSWEERATNSAEATITRAGDEELRRASRHKADPEARFHYRYQAAFLAWEAARLMPNNSEETARVLRVGGSWLQYRDPQTADLFYKSLVRRNRLTALGAAADRRRWFPDTDEEGNLLSPEEPQELSVELLSEHLGGESSAQDGSEHPVRYGYGYLVQPGDTLTAIARMCREVGLPTSVQDLIENNPRLQPARLQTGQKILIPGAQQ